MKKLLVFSLILSHILAFSVVPLRASAQTASTTPTNAELLQIINSLMQQVLALMAQLQAQGQQVAGVDTQIAPTTQPQVVQSVGSTPTEPVLTIGEIKCLEGSKTTAMISFSISGYNYNYGWVTAIPENPVPYVQNSSLTFGSNRSSSISVSNNVGLTIVKVELGTEKLSRNSGRPKPVYTLTQSVVVPDVCQ